MDPISEALQGIDLGNIMMAGAAVITLVIAITGINKVKELLGWEANLKEYYADQNYKAEMEHLAEQERKEAEEKHEYYVMRQIDDEYLSDADRARYAVYEEKYGGNPYNEGVYYDYDRQCWLNADGSERTDEQNEKALAWEFSHFEEDD